MRHVLLALALLFAAGAASAAPAYVTGEPSLGNPKAKIHVEEYGSLSCSHCAHFNNEVFPAFKQIMSEEQNAKLTSRMNKEGFKMA